MVNRNVKITTGQTLAKKLLLKGMTRFSKEQFEIIKSRKLSVPISLFQL